MDLPVLDIVLGECIWTCTSNIDGERSVCFNSQTGVILNNRIEVGKPFHHKNVVVYGSAEEIYTQYLRMITVPKEKAWINNDNMGMFSVSQLMQGVFNKHSATIMKNIEDEHPEYLI